MSVGKSGRHVVSTEEFFIENTWRCDSCGHTNRGRDMRCVECGSPKEDRPKEQYAVPSPETVPRVESPDLVRLATSASHWECPSCQSEQRSLNNMCKECGNYRYGEPPAPATPCAPEGAVSVPEVVRPARVFNAPMSDFSMPEDYSLKKPSSGRLRYIIGGGAAFALVALVVWLFTPHDRTTSVAAIAWKHTEVMEQRQQHHGSGWGARADAFNKRCERRKKGTEDCHPHDCNPHSESYDCNPYDCRCSTSTSCSDQKNGFSKCSKSTSCDTCYKTCSKTVYDTCYDQCDVFDDWCEYDYYTWDEVATKSESGTVHDERWPDLASRPDDQRVVRSASYQVRFQSGTDTWNYTPANLGEFQRYNRGAAWLVQVNYAGQVWPQRLLP